MSTVSADIPFVVELVGGTQIAAELLGFSSRLGTEMHAAMDDIVSEVSASAMGFMHWVNPTGDLENSIDDDSRVIDDFSAEIGSSLPYAARRNWGFSGGADALGRYYYDDPGAYYLDQALDEQSDYIEARIALAVARAMNPLGI